MALVVQDFTLAGDDRQVGVGAAGAHDFRIHGRDDLGLPEAGPRRPHARAMSEIGDAGSSTHLSDRGLVVHEPELDDGVGERAIDAFELGARGGLDIAPDERHDRRLAAGDLLLADVGAETPGGWASDVTRTWPVSGKYSTTQLELYEVVRASQLAAIACVRPGVRYLDVHRAAGKKLLEGLLALGIFRGELEDLYARGAAALFFPHGIGHLLGLDVHDMEDLGDRAGYAPGRTRSVSFGDRYLRLDRDLAAGMIVTIEPGYYRIPYLLERPAEVGDLESALDRRVLAKFEDVRGIRIEDDVLVTATGAEVLSASIPKEPQAVEAAMRG